MGVLLLLAFAPSGRAATFTVSNLNDSGAGSLRQAILDADANGGADTITFGGAVTGMVTLATTLPQITDPAGLTVQGPGASTFTISGNDALQVFNVASDASLSLDGLTVADGRQPDLNGSPPDRKGGGIYNAGTLTITNSTLAGNHAYYGAGVYNAGTLTVTNSTLSGNGGIYGVGLYNSGTATVTDSVVSGNGFASWGSVGGVYNSGTLWVRSTTISANSMYRDGGISNWGSLAVIGSTITGNYGLDNGGGVANHGGGTLTVDASTISRNSTDYSGGGILNGGTLVVTNSTISGNKSIELGWGGGGIDNGGTATVSNSTLSGNSAPFGGGICNSGTLTLSDSTIAANTAYLPPFSQPPDAGGISTRCWYGDTYSGSVTTITNTVLANNTGGDCALLSEFTDGDYNISSDASCGFTSSTSRMGTDPMLGPLSDNGGPTQTMALLADSPAINLIPPGTNGCGTTIATDQRGVLRPVGTGCDVGAYEDASAPVQLAFLLRAVANLGTGTSLADKVKQIQQYVAANDTTDACQGLNAFIAQVSAQTGKKLSTAQASSLTSEAKSIKAILGC